MVWQKGVRSINDLINENGTYLTLGQFQEKYQIVVNFLKYNSIISAIRQAKRSFNTGESRLVCLFIPSILQQLLRHNKGSKDMHDILKYMYNYTDWATKYGVKC